MLRLTNGVYLTYAFEDLLLERMEY